MNRHLGNSHPDRLKLAYRLVWCSLFVSCFVRPCVAGDGNLQSLKAAYIYNFSKFVTWPPSAFGSTASPITIGVIGDDGVESALEAIVRDKESGGRRLVARSIDWKDASQCQILFVSSEEQDAATKLPKFRGKPVLVVTETPGMLRYGSIINLRIESGKLRFEIETDTAKADGLAISSKLLSLARTP